MRRNWRTAAKMASTKRNFQRSGTHEMKRRCRKSAGEENGKSADRLCVTQRLQQIQQLRLLDRATDNR